MHPDFTGAVGALHAISRVLLGLLTATALSATAQSIPGLPGFGSAKAVPAAPAASAPTSADWAARLEAARSEHQALLALPASSTPLLDQRQLASARRLVLLAARVEALKSQGSGETTSDAVAVLIPKLPGQPPYSVLDVDALRDRLDALTTQQSALELGMKQLDVTVDEAVRARGEADANLRLRREQAAQAGPAAANVEELRAQVALAELLSQVMELEVLQNDERRQRARSRLAALAEPVKQLQAEVDRGRSQMRFDDADLARILKGIAAERQKLSAESAKLSERLARQETQAVPGEGWRRRAIEPLQKALQMLGELETMERGFETMWRGRYEVIAKRPQPSVVQAAALKIGKALADLQDQRRRVTEERRLLRSELRTQQALVAGLAEDDPSIKGEQQVLSALQTESDIQDRLRDGIDRATVLLERSFIDMGGTDKPASAEDWALRAWAILARTATAIWQFELFSATETTQIDGRVITVEHGVTVGKSLGVLVMLALGYWAAGRLSRLLIDLARRRVPMSAQLARVLRRWTNSILLLVVLLLVLKMARIPLTAFAFLGGALAIGIGFGAQNVIKNLISGVIILFERKIRVGDVVVDRRHVGHGDHGRPARHHRARLRRHRRHRAQFHPAREPDQQLERRQPGRAAHGHGGRGLRVRSAQGRPTDPRLRERTSGGAARAAGRGAVRGVRRQRPDLAPVLLDPSGWPTRRPRRRQRPAFCDRRRAGCGRHRHGLPAARRPPRPRQAIAG